MDLRIFISYSSLDFKIVKRLAKCLDKIGVTYFLAQEDMEWGEDINERICEELDYCVAVIVIISPASNESQWAPWELGYATAKGKTILPLLTHPALDVPDILKGKNNMLLSGFQDIHKIEDFFNLNYRRLESTQYAPSSQ